LYRQFKRNKLFITKNLKRLAFFPLALIIACVPIGSKTYSQLEPDDLPQKPTYKNNVKAIVDSKCGLCHSSKSGRIYEGIDYSSLNSLLPYTGRPSKEDEEKRGWEGFKKTAIQEMSMPPGSKNRLTPKEIAILLRWEEQGFEE